MELMDYIKRIPSEIKYILSLFLVTRIVLTAVGVLSRILLEPLGRKGFTGVYSEHIWLDVWGQFDTGWYLDIASNGYSPVISQEAFTLNQANYAFFPLYPLLMRFLGLVVGDYYVAGLIISNVCLITACILLYKLVSSESDKNTALGSLKYLFLSPAAFVFSGVFSESLFLALFIACFYYARKGNWFVVGVSGFLLSLTRSLGVVILLPLLYEYFKGDFRLNKIKPNILPLLLMPLGLCVFMGYNYYLTGDFLAFVHIQDAWSHTLSNPFMVLLNSLLTHTLAPRDMITFFNGVLAVTVVLLFLLFRRRISFSCWLAGMLLIFIPLTSGAPAVGSILRFILPVFPLYILLARLTQDSWLDKAAPAFLALIQVFLMFFWSSGFGVVV